jgi:hypothetical protein
MEKEHVYERYREGNEWQVYGRGLGGEKAAMWKGLRRVTGQVYGTEKCRYMEGNRAGENGKYMEGNRERKMAGIWKGIERGKGQVYGSGGAGEGNRKKGGMKTRPASDYR